MYMVAWMEGIIFFSANPLNVKSEKPGYVSIGMVGNNIMSCIMPRHHFGDIIPTCTDDHLVSTRTLTASGAAMLAMVRNFLGRFVYRADKASNPYICSQFRRRHTRLSASYLFEFTITVYRKRGKKQGKKKRVEEPQKGDPVELIYANSQIHCSTYLEDL